MNTKEVDTNLLPTIDEKGMEDDRHRACASSGLILTWCTDKLRARRRL
jgi:hypothetical protein